MFAPLTDGAPGAFRLTDDAALLESGPYLVSKDLLVEGVHFPVTDDFGAIAQRALRTNLSDLAAKGAKPIGYFLGCAWPKGTSIEQIEAFANGLARDQKLFKVFLYGGDTTVHKTTSGPLVVSITVFGAPARRGMLMRNGAQAGDDLYVSGTIGDAKPGLLAAKKPAQIKAGDAAYFANRFWRPTPRLALGGALSGVASAAIDLSDGVPADVGHIARQSAVCLQIDLENIPLSVHLKQWMGSKYNRQGALIDLISYGDDYEIAFTAPKSMRRSVDIASTVTKTDITRIGTVSNGDGVQVLDEDRRIIPVDVPGYDHFGGANSGD